MCGGVIFPYKKEYREILEKYYSPEDIARFEATGEVKSLYWQKGEPVMPVVAAQNEKEGDEAGGTDDGAEPRIMLWGNRDKEESFPKTGWARAESIEEGKWRYLKPKPAMIPVSFGVEKGKWFSIENGIAGLVVEKDGEERVYMLTREANPEYFDHTHHERMPVLLDQSSIPWLSGDPAGTDSASQTSFPTND
jgi:putative SOS response-associated peptidase YedK